MATATVEDVGPCKKLLKITVPADEVRAKIDESFEKLRETVSIDGFRNGRAPRRLLERRFGEKVLDEVKESLMLDASQEAMDEHGFSLIGEPSFDNIEYEDGADLTFDVTVEIKPEFELPQYTGLKLVRQKPVVTAEDVQEGLERIRSQRATLSPAPEGAEVEDGDVLTVDWAASCEGEEVAAQEGSQLNPADRALGEIEVEGLSEALGGAKVGETREAKVTFPEDHPIEKLRGKEGAVKITITSILRPTLPELDDAFAGSLDFDSLEDLRETVEGQILARREREREQDLGRQATDQLLAEANIELPEGLVKRQASDILVRRRLQLRYQGVPEDEIEEELAREQSASEESADREFKVYFLFERVAEKEKLFVTENEVENRVAQLANSYRLSVQRMRQYLEERGALSQLRIQMREEKVIEFVLKHAEIQDAE